MFCAVTTAEVKSSASDNMLPSLATTGVQLGTIQGDMGYNRGIVCGWMDKNWILMDHWVGTGLRIWRY